jgi:hypothetical protein
MKTARARNKQRSKRQGEQKIKQQQHPEKKINKF